MGLIDSVKQFGRKIPPPLWSAAELVLGTVLPGAPAVVKVVNDTVKWATMEERACPPHVTREDLQRVEHILLTLAADFKQLIENVDRIPEDRKYGLANAKVANDRFLTPAIHNLDSLAQQFDCLKVQNCELFQAHRHTAHMMRRMLELMQRQAGVADFLDESHLIYVDPGERPNRLHRFGSGKKAFATGEIKDSLADLQQLDHDQPRSPSVKVAMGISQAMAYSGSDPRVPELLETICDWSVIKGEPRTSDSDPNQSQLELKEKGITNAWLEYHIYGMISLRHLNLWGNPSVTDKGLKTIGSLVNLQELNLRKCDRVTDNGLPNLYPLKRLKKINLKFVPGVTATGIANLMRQLPSLNITT